MGCTKLKICWCREKNLDGLGGGLFSVFAAFLKGVGGKWVSLWWFFDGENVVRCVANVEKKHR
jgi:hypothetical protein